MNCSSAAKHEKAVSDMFYTIKDHIEVSTENKDVSKMTLTKALKDRMKKGQSKNEHTYLEPSEFRDWNKDGNKYLKEWVDKFNENLWAQISVENIFSNGPAVAEEHKQTNAILFGYFPHGVPFVYGGEGANFKDVYWIFYAPLTTISGQSKGIDKNGFHLSAYRDKDQNGALGALIGSNNVDGTLAVIPGGDEKIPELVYTSMP
tara:strand:+ start:486 stop:1097 length:612 start_codon:yes stop_codon:yes gene_type:complete